MVPCSEYGWADQKAFGMEVKSAVQMVYCLASEMAGGSVVEMVEAKVE